MRRSITGPGRQRGAALILSLVLLVVVTLIAVSSIRSTNQELRMSLNEETRADAFQYAQGLVDWIVVTAGTTPVVGQIGDRLCISGFTPDPGFVCNRNFAIGEPDLALEDARVDAIADCATCEYSAEIVRVGSEDSPPPRGIGTSVDKFGAAPFQVRSRYDLTEVGLGRAEVTEGALVLVPKN